MLWVKTIGSVGTDLTDLVEGLSFSNVNPGGDERAGFTYRRPWGASLPEIARGVILQIGYGVDVLWQGRIEEHDRGADGSEFISVTAYGLGARLKDNTFAEIYRDADLSHWASSSRTRRITLRSIHWNVLDFSVEPDAAEAPALALDGSGRWATAAAAEAIYDAGAEALLGSISYSWLAEDLDAGGLTAASWQGVLIGADDDALTNPVTGTDVLTGGTSGSQTETVVWGKRVADFLLNYVGASAGDVTRRWSVVPVVYGDHSLPRGAYGGFTLDQIVGDIVGRVDGITLRRADQQAYEILQAEFREPRTHEDAIADLNAYEGCNWGTWGPESPIDPSLDGYFDLTSLDLTTGHWSIPRLELSDLNINSETSTLFDTVKLTYTDIGGVSRTVSRTASVTELAESGLSPKTIKVEAGTLTQVAAQTLADTLLALTGGFAPARGSATVEQPIRHYRRGLLPPCYLRADGSNIRIPDILPARTLFDLQSSPDRRTTFPIKRVTVDVGATITATVELDQSNDLLDVLQARLGLASEVVT